jgi:hypothetical protein
MRWRGSGCDPPNAIALSQHHEGATDTEERRTALPDRSETGTETPRTDAHSCHDREWLRNEIVESEKTQADFLKWKFILIAAVGSVSLGFTSSTTSSTEGAQFLLCLVPLLCAYVDLVSLHIMGRITTLGNYLKRTGDFYEEFVFTIRSRTGTSPYAFEALALHGSSIALNLILIGMGFLLPTKSAATGAPLWNPYVLEAYKFAGLAGLVITVGLIIMYEFRRDKVDRLADEFFKKQAEKK